MCRGLISLDTQETSERKAWRLTLGGRPRFLGAGASPPLDGPAAPSLDFFLFTLPLGRPRPRLAGAADCSGSQVSMRDRMRSGDLDKVGEPKEGAGKRLACSRACSRRLIVVCRIADFLLGDVIIYRRGRHVRGRRLWRAASRRMADRWEEKGRRSWGEIRAGWGRRGCVYRIKSRCRIKTPKYLIKDDGLLVLDHDWTETRARRLAGAVQTTAESIQRARWATLDSWEFSVRGLRAGTYGGPGTAGSGRSQ